MCAKPLALHGQYVGELYTVRKYLISLALGIEEGSLMIIQYLRLIITKMCTSCFLRVRTPAIREGRMEGGREGGREGRREGGREGGRE